MFRCVCFGNNATVRFVVYSQLQKQQQQNTRSGRSSSEDVVGGADVPSASRHTARSPPYSPPFSPRLGRQVSSLARPQVPRLGRDVDGLRLFSRRDLSASYAQPRQRQQQRQRQRQQQKQQTAESVTAAETGGRAAE